MANEPEPPKGKILEFPKAPTWKQRKVEKILNKLSEKKPEK